MGNSKLFHTDPHRGNCHLWLTWKLIRKQKLRTAAISCGLLFSVILLGAFGNFGYDFWVQVHEGSGENVGYDRTQLILTALVAVLLALVAGCAGILLHNLYTLTFAQRWRSLTRLTALGATSRDLVIMTLQENVFFFCASALPGGLLTALSGKIVGIRCCPPFWLAGGILLWIWMVSCLCSLRPLRAALRGTSLHENVAALHKNAAPLRENKVTSHKNAASLRENVVPLRRNTVPLHENAESLRENAALIHNSDTVCIKSGASLRNTRTWHKKPAPPPNFTFFMTRKYRHANRGQHIRVILTILSAILLYTPVSYLIETNIAVQRAELEARHGIQYSCSPRTKAELENALSECRLLADSASVIYVSLSACASVETNVLSRELLNLLRRAGWREEEAFYTGSAIYFLEDRAYAGYLEACGISASASAVLIDRYINRRSWSVDTSPSYQEAPLLDTQKNSSGVTVYYEPVDESEWDMTKAFSPDAVARQIPEGLSFGGELSLVLPLGKLEDFLSSRTDYHNLEVYGKFQDPDDTSFFRMEELLGPGSAGSLRYTRKILQEWYASMSGIHRAMNAICALLFLIAVLHIFSMMLLQYMERRHGLAILWSLGLSPGELLKILTGEHIRNLLAALVLGIPISGLLCYYIYRIFRQAWQVDFAFPLKQTLLIAVSVCALALLAVLAEGLLMRRQDFLKDIKEIL